MSSKGDPALQIHLEPVLDESSLRRIGLRADQAGKDFSNRFKSSASLKAGDVDTRGIRESATVAAKEFTTAFNKAVNLSVDVKTATVAADAKKAATAFSATWNKSLDLKYGTDTTDIVKAAVRDSSLYSKTFNKLAKVSPNVGTAGVKPSVMPSGSAGDDFVDDFERTVKARFAAAGDVIPPVKVTADSSDVDRELSALKSKIDKLSKSSFEINVSNADVLAKVAEVEAHIARLRDMDVDIDVEVKLEGASARMALLREQLANVGRDAGLRFRQELRATIDAMPDIKVDADLNVDTVMEIEQLKAELAAIADTDIDVDIDTAATKAKIKALELTLASIKDPDIRPKVHIGAALAGLATLRTAMAAMDSSTNASRILTPIATTAITGAAALGALALAFGALAVAATPVIAVLIGGLGALLPIILAVGAGFGVLIAAVIPLAKAYMDSEANAKKLAAAQNNLAAAQKRQADAAKNVERASKNLQKAQADAAESAERSARAVADAEEELERTRKSNQRSEQDGLRSVADARSSAAEAAIDANERVADSERSLADAKRSLLDIGKSIAEIREKDKRTLEDMNLAIEENAAAQNKAIVELQEAENQLAEARRNQDGQALGAAQARQRAALANYDKTKLAGSRLKEDRSDLKANGSDQLQDAQKNRVKALERIRDAEKAVAEANSDRTKTTMANERRIADALDALARTRENNMQNEQRAVRAVADAQAAQASASIAAQEAIQSAQEGQSEAMAAYAEAQREVATASQEAADIQVESMNSMSPAMAGVLAQLQLFINKWKEVGTAAAMAMAPGLSAAMTNLDPLLAPLTAFAAEVGGLFGSILENATEALSGPFWTQWATEMGPIILEILESLAVSLGHLITGFAGLAQAFGPLGVEMMGGLEGALQGFSDWATQLKDNPAFIKFVEYVKESAPIVGDLLGTIFDVIINFGKGAAEPGNNLLEKFTGWLENLANMDPAEITKIINDVGAKIQGIIDFLTEWGDEIIIVAGALVVLGTGLLIFKTAVGILQGVLLVARTAVWLFNLALAANPIMLAVVAIGAIIAALVLFFTKTETGQKMWKSFMEWFGGIYENYVKPALDVVVSGLGVAWENAKKSFNGFIKFFSDLWNGLYNAVIKPFIDLFWLGIDWLVKQVKGFIDGMFKAWDKLSKVYETYVKPFVDKIWNGIFWLKGQVGEFVGKMTEGFNKFTEGIKNFRLPAIELPGRANGGYIDYLPRLAGGGMIPGPYVSATADNVLGVTDQGIPIARVNPMEYILPVRAVKALVAEYGPGFLEWLRTFDSHNGRRLSGRPEKGGNGQLPKFDTGGFVTPAQLAASFNVPPPPPPAYAGGGTVMDFARPGATGLDDARIVDGLVDVTRSIGTLTERMTEMEFALKLNEREFARATSEATRYNNRMTGGRTR